MASPLDIIEIPGHPGMFARRNAVEAWQRAGSPKLRDAGRLYGEQKRLWDGYANGTPGFYPADNPDETWRDLSHLRFVAFDIWSDYAYWRPKMLAAGFEELSYEAWHFFLPNPKQYGIVTSIPASAYTNASPFPNVIQEEDEMLALNITGPTGTYSCTLGVGVFRHLLVGDNPERVKNIIRSADDWQTITLQELPTYLRTYGCDLNIWDIRDGDFAILDPLTGTVKAGNVWTIENARYADLVKKIAAPEVVTPPKA